MQVDTPFWLAGVTNLYVAAAFFRLYERGLVALREPITTYLPGSLVDDIHWLGGRNFTHEITPLHLLGHTSGLPDYLEDTLEEGGSLFGRLREADRAWTVQHVMRIVRQELVPRFTPQRLDAKRQKISYSDTNYQLLIAIIEAVTGKPLHAVFDELFYRPLGLTNTYLPDARPGPEPEPATVWFGEQPLHIPRAMRSLRQLVSTADETLTFMRALVRGDLFNDPATSELLKRRESWARFGLVVNPAPASPTWPIEYGLGMMRLTMPRLLPPFRSIPAMVGHTGISGSWLFHVPELDLFITGTVDQVLAGGVPFRFVPGLLAYLARGTV
jgi:CubicO group peptidase (beta-lactamase class C family)